MILVGARFETLAAAHAALVEVGESVPVEAGALAMRPLGSLRYEAPREGIVVAGRFRSEDVDRVVEILRQHGGEIVSRRAEWRPPRPVSRGSERGCARCQSFTRLRRSPR